MNGGFAIAAVVRATQGFAIKGNNLVLRRDGGCLNPAQEAGLKAVRVEGSKDATKGIVGGNAVGKVEKGLEPGQFRIAKFLDLDPAICPTNDATDSNGEEVEQMMAFGAVNTRIGE